MPGWNGAALPPAQPPARPREFRSQERRPPRCPWPPRWADRQEGCWDRAQAAALSWGTPTPHGGLPRKARARSATSLQRPAHRSDHLSTRRPAHPARAGRWDRAPPSGAGSVWDAHFTLQTVTKVPGGSRPPGRAGRLSRSLLWPPWGHHTMAVRSMRVRLKPPLHPPLRDAHAGLPRRGVP